MFSALVKATLSALGLADNRSTDLYADDAGALWVRQRAAAGLATAAVTAANTATALGSSASYPRGIFVQCPSTSPESVFVGGSSVTTSNGLELTAGSPGVSLDVTDPAAVYAISAAGTGTVRWAGQS